MRFRKVAARMHVGVVLAAAGFGLLAARAVTDVPMAMYGTGLVLMAVATCAYLLAPREPQEYAGLGAVWTVTAAVFLIAATKIDLGGVGLAAMMCSVYAATFVLLRAWLRRRASMAGSEGPRSSG